MPKYGTFRIERWKRYISNFVRYAWRGTERKFCSLECIFLKRKEFKGNKVSIYHKLEETRKSKSRRTEIINNKINSNK